MAEQLQLDFTGKRPSARAHFRTTTLTTTWDTYRKLKDIDIGVPISIEFVNDIVSSCRGSGNSEDHHTVRRCELLSRQFRGGFNKLKVRAKQGVDLECVMLDRPIGNSDACACYIRVCKPRQ